MSQIWGGDSALTLRHWATVNVAQVVHCTDLEGITYMIVCSGQKYSATLRPHPVPTLYCSTVFFQLPAMYSGLLVGFSNVCVCVCVCVNNECLIQNTFLYIVLIKTWSWIQRK